MGRKEWMTDEMEVKINEIIKHQSMTIGSDVEDAIERSNSLEEFKENVLDFMQNLYSEINYVLEKFGIDGFDQSLR